MTDLTRRQFAVLTGSAALLGAGEPTPWHQRVRRIGQVNFSEKDVAEANIPEWADYWASCRVEAVQINVTGMIAFYPTEVPFHKRSRYLGNRDFFGECCRAAKAKGIRVIGWSDRISRNGLPGKSSSRTLLSLYGIRLNRASASLFDRIC